MDSQLPLKQIELKNNKIFTIIIICTTLFSILNFSINFYMIKFLRHLNVSLNFNSNNLKFKIFN